MTIDNVAAKLFGKSTLIALIILISGGWEAPSLLFVRAMVNSTRLKGSIPPIIIRFMGRGKLERNKADRGRKT